MNTGCGIKPTIHKEGDRWCLRFWTSTHNGTLIPAYITYQGFRAALADLELCYRRKMVVKNIGWSIGSNYEAG